MPGRAAVFRSAPRLAAVDRARVFCARMLATWSVGEVEEPVTAIVIELVANAVVHAGTDLEVRLSADGPIRIEVRDQDPAPAVLRIPGLLQEGGRGMVIVEVYSSRWGVIPVRDGKTVWAEIDLPAAGSPWRPAA